MPDAVNPVDDGPSADVLAEIARQQDAHKDAITHQRVSDFLARFPQSPETLDILSGDKTLSPYIPRLPWHADVYADDRTRAINAGPYGALNAVATGLFPSPDTSLQDRTRHYMAQQQAYERGDHFPIPAADVLRGILDGKTPEQLLEAHRAAQATPASSTPAAPATSYHALASSPLPPAPPMVAPGSRPHSDGTVYGSPLADAMMQQATGVDTAAAAAARQSLAERNNFDAALNSPLYHQQIAELTAHGLDEVSAAQLARMRTFQAEGLDGAYLRSPVSAYDRAGYQQEGDRELADMARTGDPRFGILGPGTFARDHNGNISRIAPDGTNAVYPAGTTPTPATPYGASMQNAALSRNARITAAQTQADGRSVSALFNAARAMSQNADPATAKQGQAIINAVIPFLLPNTLNNAYRPSEDGSTGYDN